MSAEDTSRDWLDEDIAIAYATGLSTRAVGEKFGIGRERVRSALRRAGVRVRTRTEGTPRRAARAARERQAREPWAADAARRYEAGETVAALAREYGVYWMAARRAIARQGIPARCRKCGYLKTALGHLRKCGEAA